MSWGHGRLSASPPCWWAPAIGIGFGRPRDRDTRSSRRLAGPGTLASEGSIQRLPPTALRRRFRCLERPARRAADHALSESSSLAKSSSGICAQSATHAAHFTRSPLASRDVAPVLPKHKQKGPAFLQAIDYLARPA